jgi:hypothetical protein
MSPAIPTRTGRKRAARGELVPSVAPDPRPPRAIAAEFRALVAGGARLLPAGSARRAPGRLLPRYLPHHRVDLLDASYWLTDFRYEEGLNFLVAWVGLRERSGAIRRLWPRIFYKDSSLLWRVASHVIRLPGDDWIGKGDVRVELENGEEVLVSDEDTTNLPYEIQGALDTVSRAREARRDDGAVALVLRNAPAGRLEPYADFTAPRRRAARAARLNGGRPVARLRRRGDPSSLWFAPGFAPDLDAGALDEQRSASRLYGGDVRKLRFPSENRAVQYQFVAAPRHVWLNPPQATTTELTTYGLRALHVPADDDIFLPGYEYSFTDPETGELYSQIPEGYAGEPSDVDPRRADASPWLEALPIVKEFRRKVLRGRRG